MDELITRFVCWPFAQSCISLSERWFPFLGACLSGGFSQWMSIAWS